MGICNRVYRPHEGQAIKDLMQELTASTDWQPHSRWKNKRPEKQKGRAAARQEAGQRQKVLLASW